MPYRKRSNYPTSRKRTTRKRKSKYTEAEKLAYKVGQVMVGCQNEDSKVYESMVNGMASVTEKKSRKSKPLF